MEYIGIGICVIAVVAICIFVIQRKNNIQEENPSTEIEANAEEYAITTSNDAPAELVIEMEMRTIMQHSLFRQMVKFYTERFFLLEQNYLIQELSKVQ